MLERAKAWARTLKREITALWLAVRDPRTPRFAKYLAVALLAFALSPIDLIPDFVPLLGLLDDLVILPLGIVLLLRLMPAELMNEFRRQAQYLGRLPASRSGLVFVALVWAGAFMLVALWVAGAWM